MRLPNLIFFFFMLSLAGCAAAPGSPSPTARPAASYPDLGAAPELTNAIWLNTPHPLRLANLRGKVVLIDMWTFG